MADLRTWFLTHADVERIADAGGTPPSSGNVETSPSNGRILVAESAFPRPDRSGHRIVCPGHAEIYLVDRDGYRRRVPNHTTYNRLFRSWSGIEDEPCLAEIALGQQFTPATMLVRGDASARVYLLDQGARRLIVDASIMDRYWFDWARIVVVKQALIDRTPVGLDWA